MKTLSLPPTLPVGECADCKIVNLRPSRQLKDVLRPVDIPLPRVNYSGTPVCVHSGKGGLLTLFSINDGYLTAYDSVHPSKQLFEAHDGEIISATPLEDRVIFMRRGKSPMEVVCVDGVWQLMSDMPFPKVRFGIESEVTLSGRTPARTLQGRYVHWTGPMDDADRTVLTSDLMSLYADISDQARLANRYVQPVMVWWRLVDIFGRTYHRSAPVVIGPEGIQGTGDLMSSVASANGCWSALNGFPMSLKAFRAKVSVGKSRWMGCKVEVLMTPPIDVVAAGGDGVTAFVFGTSSATEATMVASLPSADTGQVVAAMLDRLDTISSVVASIGADGDDTTTVTLHPERLLPSVKEREAVFKALRAPVADIDPMVIRCRLPHTFSAGASHVSADTIVWGDILPIAALPTAPSGYAVEWGDNDEEWAEVVQLGDTVAGSVADCDSAFGSAPLRLSPLVCYPSPTASRVSMQLSSFSVGGRRCADFSLTPTPAGRWSFHVDNGLRPVNPAEWADGDPLQPVTGRSESGYGNSILVSSSIEPLQPVLAVRLNDGVVRAITAASRTSSAWDFGRRHLYVFTSSAIHAMSVSRIGWSASVNTILPVGVMSAAGVAATPVGVMAVGTDGLIRRVNGSSASIFVSPDTPVRALGWSSFASELWAIAGGEHEVTVFDSASLANFRRTDVKPQMLLSNGAQLYLPLDGTLYEVSRGHIAPFTSVSVMMRLPFPLRSAVRHVEWRLSASMATLNLDVSGDNGSPLRRQRVVRIATAGPVNAPVCAAMPSAPPYANITVGLQGSVSADTLIATTTLSTVAATRCGK